MIRVLCQGHDYRYEVKDILYGFCCREEVEFVENEVRAQGPGLFVHSSLTLDQNSAMLYSKVSDGDRACGQTSTFRIEAADEADRRKQYKRMVKHNLLMALEKFFERGLPWGILTGIRPVKVVHKLLDRGMDVPAIKQLLTDFYRVSDQKADLSLDIALREREFILPYDRRKVSIYIGIPFCPTRCSYCSFTSYELGKWGGLIAPYIERLTSEIEQVSTLLQNAGYSCDTVYVGGGTPTSLVIEQLKHVLDSAVRHFVTGSTREFTVEAGRPDTLDAGKLRAIKEAGVTRIAINPQSMNSETLCRIGRRHTPEDIEQAFELARHTGHRNINMDLIMGLPGEDLAMVKNTLDRISRLKPEGLTVHTLAIKRASRLNEQISEVDWVDGNEVERMLKAASDTARSMGMNPYYLYKQRYMVGNYENVGYSLPGFEGIYNMQIMEEKQTIIGLGAGAASKLVFLDEDRIERVANLKNVEYYISRFEDMMNNKIQQILKLIDGTSNF
jgi:coproporphyrinogen dehydrogenase HemZ